MTITFNYNKKQVIQALRYHFISITELRIMIILVNAFAILSLILYVSGKITPVAFLLYAFLWIMLMISIWFILPTVVYNRTQTFKHGFTMYFNEHDFTLEHEKGKRSWPYSSLKSYKETPYFFHLYFDKRSFLLVPKAAFRSLDEVQQLRELLKNKI
ncbi:MAG: YcxB family protein [Niabella sp.]